MTDKVRTYMEEQHMIEQGDRIVLGVSGGADSVALLMLLAELKEQWQLRLFVVHVHHGIRKEADEDVRYVQQLCAQFNLPCSVFYEDIPALAKQQKMSEEEVGRVCRYRHFYEVAGQVNANKLAVAHHMDDQAETVLFHLVRGSGLSGVRGMQPVNAWEKLPDGNNLWIIRPFLCCRKKELTQYLQEKKVDWQEDTTNAGSDYARNRIRNRVLPELETVNDQAVMHIASFAQNMSEYECFFKQMVKEYLLQNVRENARGERILNREHLLKQQPVLGREVLYELLCVICGHRKDISAVHVRNLYELLKNQSGRKCSLPYDMYAYVSYENLIIGKSFQKGKTEDTPVTYMSEIAISGLMSGKEQRICIAEGQYLYARILDFTKMNPVDRENFINNIRNSKNNYTKFFACDTIKNTLHIRNPMENDYLTIDQEGNRKRLRRYFIDAKIPAHMRESTPVIACGNDILWVIGGRSSEGYRVCEDTQYILELRCEGVNDELSC